jgi:anthranilate phosphoribosyltransferase
VPFPVQRRDLIDVCGTGGDGTETFNISTANALLLAAAGLGVVKHGNRAVSSLSGSADVLEALGLRLDHSVDELVKAVDTIGFAFLFAPQFHPAMRHVGPTRRALGVRTLFNILGPLANPSPVERQVIGVFSPKWLSPVAEALRQLGTTEALVVWGHDGVDEVSLSGETYAMHLKQGVIEELRLRPEDFGVSPAPLSTLRGGDRDQNARIIRDILRGEEKGPPRDVVLINAAAALRVAGKVQSWKAGVELARDLLESGAAAQKLSQLQGAL